MNVRLGILVTVAALASALVVVAAPASAASAGTVATVPITGTTPDGGTFAGTLDVTRVAAQAGQLVAVGTLSGTLKDASGGVIGTVSDVATTLPLNAVGTCNILHLTLGPLDLNLLGLKVHLDRVVLDITAQSGPGNLLGNLLCSIAHLLDNGNPLAAIAQKVTRALALQP